VGPDTQADAEAGSFCLAKQTRAKTAGVASAAALARRANRDPQCDIAVRPHGRMRDRPAACAQLQHA